MILLPIIIYIYFLINLSSNILFVYCENLTICQQQEWKNFHKTFIKYENPIKRIFTRKKRFIVFPNYCSMKITVAMGKSIIVKYPRGLNLSLEVSVYYALPTILAEWYPKYLRRKTTPKPTIPRRKNPPVLKIFRPRIDNDDNIESIEYINSQSNEFINNLLIKNGNKFENLIKIGTTTTPTTTSQPIIIGIENLYDSYKNNSGNNNLKSNYYLKKNWYKNFDKNLLVPKQQKFKFNKNFSTSSDQYNRDKWQQFNRNKTDWSYYLRNSEKNYYNDGNNYLKYPTWDIQEEEKNWLMSPSTTTIKKPQINLKYNENLRKSSIEKNWNKKKSNSNSKYWENDQQRSNYYQYKSNLNHEDIYEQIPKNYPDLDEYKNWKHYRGHRDRRDIYNHLESFSSLLKIDMKDCILRSICESKKYLLPPGYSLIQDILRVLFSLPTTDGMIDEYSKVMRDENGECLKSFKESCPFSLLDILMNPDKTE